MAPPSKILTLLALAAISVHVAVSLEFMDEGPFSNEQNHALDDDNSAEVPPVLTGYTRDTIAHFNPRKSDAGFRQLWERVPLQKVDVIKR